MRDISLEEAFGKTNEITISAIKKWATKSSVPLLEGKLRGAALIIIDIELEYVEPMILFMAGMRGSMILIDRVISSGESGDGTTIGVHVYMRHGMTNTWAHFHMGMDLEDEPSSGDDDYAIGGGTSGPDQDTVSRLALAVASIHGFGALRNRDQRRVVASEVILKYLNCPTDEFTVDRVVVAAETIYEVGILPQMTQEMKNAGCSLKEIQEATGLSKQRVQRALSIKVTDHMIEIMKNGAA